MSGYILIKGRTILALVASTRGAPAAVCTTIHSAAPLPPLVILTLNLTLPWWEATQLAGWLEVRFLLGSP